MADKEVIKVLTQKRGSYKTKLTLFEKYLNGFKSDDSNRCEVIELNQRIARISMVIDDFEATQAEIEYCALDDVELAQLQIQEREDFENIYHSLLSKAKMLLEKFDIIDDALSSASGGSKGTKINTHAPKQHNTFEKMQGVILPEIKVPRFNGSYDTWLEFRDLFKSLIHNSDQLSDIQKYHYLRDALVESAPQIIQSIEFVGDNYQTAWKTLCERFDNKNLLINNHLRSIFQMESIAVVSASKIRFLYENLYKHLSCLKQLGEPTSSWDTLLIYIISNKLDKQSAQEWEKHKLNLTTVNLESFKEFLKRRACMLETVDLNFPKYEKNDTKKYGNQNSYRKNEHYSNTKSLVGTKANDDSSYEKSNCNYSKPKFGCLLCKGNHRLFYCSEFLSQVVSSCKWSGCKICSKMHNTVLCDKRGDNEAKNVNQSVSVENASNAKTHCTLATAQSTILSTAQVNVCSPSASNSINVPVRAMLDSGSQSSFITTRLCEKLDLQKNECKLAVYGISENISYAKYKCDINVKSKDNSFSFDLSCFVLDNITSDLPEFHIDISSLSIPVDINLADEEFYVPQPIDLLIGADAFWQLLSIGQLSLGVMSPILQNTRLGWVVAGLISMPKHQMVSKTRCNLSRDVSIVQQQLSKFWDIEEAENCKSTYSIEEQQCENHFAERTSTDENGRFVVSIPFKQSPLSLGESRDHALKRFLSLEKRLSTDENLRNLYTNFLLEYEQLGYMTDITNRASEKPEYYMPHHGVLKEASSSTKLRVVFNASAPTSNDCLHLQLYRDSKDRYKQGQTKASLSLEHFLGLESGFTLDKESHTVAIVCQDVVVVLAFDNRERLMQWQIKLSSHLNDGPHFLVLVSSSPLKTKLPPGPARLHVQERSFCLTTGVPPRIAGQWQIADLRRYGVVDGRFCFEGGSRCLKGEGLYILIADQGDEIMAALQAASTGNLHSSRKRPVSRNMSVMDSPARRSQLRASGGIAQELRESETSLTSRANSPYTDLESNYGCGDSISNDGWNQPSIERCMSCISKLGAMSRSSTATVTVGPTMGAPPCWEHTCDRHSISSSSDSSGWSQAVTRPPQRPPKLGSSSPSPKRPAMPPPSYNNYDVPKLPYPVEPNHNEHYDTPRKLKECIGFETVQKPCGCILRIRQPEPERPCVCQRLMSCWTAPEDSVNAVYATVDYSKKTYRCHPNPGTTNYANLTPVVASNGSTNAKNNQTTTLQPSSNYENMEFAQTLQLYENGKEISEKARSLCAKCGHVPGDYLLMEPSKSMSNQAHPGYIPMSPAVKQRLSKALSNSNPNLGPALDRSSKPAPGSAMLHAGDVYQRKQILDNADDIDSARRKRSNSADSSTSRAEPEADPDAASPCKCVGQMAQTAQLVRRSSSVPCKSNRDSSSSNDSGVFELPRRAQITSNLTLPRRSKSSDPLRDLSFQFNKAANEGKSASAEAEVPLCPNGSTSSGTSDMSDYFETLSLSSHSSSVEPPPPSCTLRPRSGNEYLSLQRLIAPVPEEHH